MITIDGFQIDALISIDPSHTARATSHPIEEGANVSDHVIKQPPLIVIEGVVTDTPLSNVTRLEGIKPSSEAYAHLLAIYNESRLVSIVSKVYPTFDNLTCVSLSGPKTIQTGDAFRFRATFQQLTLINVSSETELTLVELPRHQKKRRKGAKPSETKAVEDVKPPADDGSGKSIAKHMLDWVTD